MLEIMSQYHVHNYDTSYFNYLRYFDISIYLL